MLKMKEYIRPWGKHTNGTQKLIIKLGTTNEKVEIQKLQNGVLIDKKHVLLKKINLDEWTLVTNN